MGKTQEKRNQGERDKNDIVQPPFKRVGGGECIVSPKKADELLKYNTFPHQRPLDMNNVKHLAEEHKNGVFHDAVLQFITVLDSDNRYQNVPLFDPNQCRFSSITPHTTFMGNGQHTCHMIKLAGIEKRVFYSHYVSHSMEGAATLFSKIDVNKIRNQSDINRYVLRTHGVDWPRQFMDVMVSATSLISGIHPDFTKRMDRALLALEYIEEGIDIMPIIGRKKSGSKHAIHMYRSPVVAEMIRTHRKARETNSMAEWESFWTRVKNGLDIQEADAPIGMLREWLMQTTLYNSSPGKESSTNREMRARCVSAWNAFRRGKTLKILKYYAERPIPAPI